MEFIFKFNKQDAQKILDALSKEPYRNVVDVIDKLQQQASEQMQPTESNS